jgi:protein-tyrosine phosphatase
MWRILPRLYLGDQYDACNHHVLEHAGVTHVLNCAREVPCSFRSRFRYLHLKLMDPDGAFIDHIPDICRFIRVGRRRGGVLVHCRMGISRSVAAILAYLCSRGKTLEEGYRILQRGVREADEFMEPNEVFLIQIRDYFELDDPD